jgi:hypothetical protein
MRWARLRCICQKSPCKFWERPVFGGIPKDGNAARRRIEQVTSPARSKIKPSRYLQVDRHARGRRGCIGHGSDIVEHDAEDLFENVRPIPFCSRRLAQNRRCRQGGRSYEYQPHSFGAGDCSGLVRSGACHADLVAVGRSEIALISVARERYVVPWLQNGRQTAHCHSFERRSSEGGGG